MTHQFSRIPQAQIPRSSFDRSHGHKTTFDAGFLIPIYVDEALPGDTFNMRLTAFARLATPIHPIMDNMFMETFFFAVPIRLIWDNWQKFNGEQENPGDSTDYKVPLLDAVGAGGFVEGSIHDYFGIPTGIQGIQPTCLHHRAYNLIYSEWFRDQNLQDAPVLRTDDGPDSISSYPKLRRGKRHDYFTSCLPWPQKGDAVSIGLGGFVDVQRGSGTNTFPRYEDSFDNEYRMRVPAGLGNSSTNSVWADNTLVESDVEWATGQVGLRVDLSNATAVSINELRQAFQIQKLLERDARGGTRYTEIVRAHFGVISPDARLQRPEYLGGGSSPVVISPVAQTSETATSPQGNLAAFGTTVLNNHGFTKSFTEHCVLIGLVSVRADLTYQQGLHRMWKRQTRYDFYWPALSHIGEQAVLNQEIYADGNPVNDEAVFGYQERYAEYRYFPSKVTGLFRSSAAASLDAWHLSEEFSTLPVLGDTFIQSNPPVDRVIAVQSEPHFLFDGFFNLKCARPMPLYGVPGLIDHF